ncbi:hypothetical protein NGRA_2960 [Nosema granulosis]|uniref:Peptidase A2 domain-containing protein n=1 Tax=Nosema granulosis TaxID=83296 RepID=A0A9P6GX53_9MICR|nr:hypothetical protein NGRA_2960 [Nosema granulosis]
MISLNDFTLLFKKRFSNIYKTEVPLSKFLTASPHFTREEFTALLNAGTILFKQKLMNSCALAQVLIGKSPDNIKSLLFQAIKQFNDWHLFIQRAEQVAWLAYPDKTFNRISSQSQEYQNINQQPKRKGRGYVCDLHGEGNHDSDHCKGINRLKGKGWIKTKNINAIYDTKSCKDPLQERETEIKSSYVYSQSTNFSNNPFFVKFFFEGIQRNCLLDTGSDVSVIHTTMVPKHLTTTEFKGQIRSVGKEILPVTRRVQAVEGYISGRRVVFTPLITEGNPQYIILGADVLTRYPELIQRIFKRKISVNSVEEKSRIPKQI